MRYTELLNEFAIKLGPFTGKESGTNEPLYLKDGGYLIIQRNPTRPQVLNLIKTHESKMPEKLKDKNTYWEESPLRGFVLYKKVYLWDSYDADHSDVIRMIIAMRIIDVENYDDIFNDIGGFYLYEDKNQIKIDKVHAHMSAENLLTIDKFIAWWNE